MRLARPRLGAARTIGLALLAALALAAIVLGLLAGQARRQALALADRVAQVAEARAADQDGADLFADATLGEELAALATHLPPDTKLAMAARDAAGNLRIAVDSADPDALRQTLRADPWFADFRERGQSAADNGALRVTFERQP